MTIIPSNYYARSGNRIKKNILLLAYVPTFIGAKGDATNERQLIYNLCKEIGKSGGRCLIIANLNVEEIVKCRKCRQYVKNEMPRNASLILIPLVAFQPLKMLLRALLSFIIAIELSIYIFLSKSTMYIYVRESENSFGFITLPWFRNKTIVKVPFIAEDEYSATPVFAGLLKMISKCFDYVAMTHAGGITTHTALFLKTLVLRRKLKPASKLLLTPPGVDRSKIIKIRKEKEVANFSKKKDSYIIGLIGSLNEYQGADLLLHAVASLKDSFFEKPLALLIVGDGPERKKIEKLCKKFKLNCRITGFVSHEEALKYLSSFDIMVLPRLRTQATESIIPIKIIEAWALGIPVVVTRHKVFEYMKLKDMEDIVYAEPTPSDLANKILLVLKNNELRRKLSIKGPALAEKFYYDKIASRLLNAFESCAR
jgi:glycosyltransferase involved in cell wall biosynthesis